MFKARAALSITRQFIWLVWRGGNGVGRINKVTPRRARLVLESVTTFGGFTIPVFIQVTQTHSAWPSLRGLVQ